MRDTMDMQGKVRLLLEDRDDARQHGRHHRRGGDPLVANQPHPFLRIEPAQAHDRPPGIQV